MNLAGDYARARATDSSELGQSLVLESETRQPMNNHHNLHGRRNLLPDKPPLYTVKEQLRLRRPSGLIPEVWLSLIISGMWKRSGWEALCSASPHGQDVPCPPKAGKTVLPVATEEVSFAGRRH